MHPLHSASVLQMPKSGQIPTPAVSGAATGAAEADEAQAATTATAITGEKRIVCELCDIEPDSFEEDSRRTVCFFVLRISI